MSEGQGESKPALLKEIRFSSRDRLHAAYGLPKNLCPSACKDTNPSNTILEYKLCAPSPSCPGLSLPTDDIVPNELHDCKTIADQYLSLADSSEPFVLFQVQHWGSYTESLVPLLLKWF